MTLPAAGRLRIFYFIKRVFTGRTRKCRAPAFKLEVISLRGVFSFWFIVSFSNHCKMSLFSCIFATKVDKVLFTRYCLIIKYKMSRIEFRNRISYFTHSIENLTITMVVNHTPCRWLPPATLFVAPQNTFREDQKFGEYGSCQSSPADPIGIYLVLPPKIGCCHKYYKLCLWAIAV